MTPPPTQQMFGLPVAAIGADELIRTLLEWSAEDTARRRSRVVSYLNAHTVNLAGRNPEFHAVLSEADLLYADGMSIVRASRSLGAGLPERISAADFFDRFLWAAASRGRRIALVGSDEATVRACAATLQSRVPGVTLCFVHHGHFRVGTAEEESLLRELNESRPDIVVLGMGSPRQERWAHGHASRIHAPVIWCVGALFEYYATRRRAPAWMREIGLEWLFRFAMEPRRLAGRYLLGNLEFLWRLSRETRRIRRK